MKPKKILAIGGGAILGIAIAAFLWVWWAPCSLGGCAPLDQLAEYQAEGSELLDINGQPFARLATVNRRIVSLDSLPPHVPQAFVAIEDQRFYSHGGIDFFRTMGALVSNVKSGGVAEGGSTITQQLARNLFPDWLPYTQRNVRRKILEARVARQIERTFAKDKILELYINHIYLGNGAYGIEAASRTYFGKSASELTVMEAATLAGVPQSPSQGNPKDDLERATNRRNLVLSQMVEAGYIDAATAEAAKAEQIVVTEEEAEDGPESSYFVEQVRRELESQVGTRFYTAGLKIHTTLDPVAQQAAEEELYRQLDAIESGSFGTYRHMTYASSRGKEGSAYLQGAVVVMDALTGEVRALVGGRNFNDSHFNRATQALRQPGSAFKPFVYATALERYRTPAHLVDDSPLKMTFTGGQVWEPKNYADSYDGTITMREALTRSKNVATVRIAQEVGLRPAIRLAGELGITSEIPDVPATALGAADVRPIELIAAYAAFANGGSRVEPHLITRVLDREGRVLWEAGPRRTQVMDPGIAFVLTSMLQDVVDRGTGTAVRAVGFQGAAAGKTGTTNDASDVWFIGYTPDLVAGVWMGLDEPATIVRGASGGTLAAPVWGRMMRKIYANRTMYDGWSTPAGVTTAEVDRVTGAAIDGSCPAQGPVITEYFVRSAPPQQYCPRYTYETMYPMGDTGWVDEEWGDYEYDPANDDSTLRPGVDWPELEALRRRIRQRAELYDDLADRVNGGTPGAIPPASGVDPAMGGLPAGSAGSAPGIGVEAGSGADPDGAPMPPAADPITGSQRPAPGTPLPTIEDIIGGGDPPRQAPDPQPAPAPTAVPDPASAPAPEAAPEPPPEVPLESAPPP